MKPKTKKILIIAIAVAIVAVIAWLVFRKRSNSTAGIISKLDASKDLKDALSSMVDYIGNTWDDAHKKLIAQKATANNRTLAQQTVMEAAYALYDAKQIDDATYQGLLSQILAIN